MSSNQTNTLPPGFSPSYAPIVKEVGPGPAIVFGAVYFYSTGYLGKCTANQKTLADFTGLSVRTVGKALRALSDQHKLLADLTPKQRNKPHVYKITEKALSLLGLDNFGRKTLPSSTPQDLPSHTEEASVSDRRGCGLTPKRLRSHTEEASDEQTVNKPINKNENKNRERGIEKLHKDSLAKHDRSLLQTKEIEIYKKVTNQAPKIKQLKIIYDTIRDNDFSPEDLKEYWIEWISRSHGEHNLGWLCDWAVNKRIPGPRNIQKSQDSRGDGAKYLSGKFAEFIETG